MKNGVLTTCMALAAVFAAPSFAQQTFDSPDAAAQAIIHAAGNHDQLGLQAIFGPAGNAILTTGNREQDEAEQSEFSRLAQAQHRLIPDPINPNREILSIGDEDWPFPVPIVKSGAKWSFDPSGAKAEIEARRIGTHELDAIEICAGYVDAQKAYASQDHGRDGILKYAAHMVNVANQPDGSDSLNSLVPKGLAEATWDGQKAPLKPYHGYYFRILEGQGPHAPGGAHNYVVNNKLMGGFGLVAWPAQYGVSGIHTFMVNQDGVIYEKDIAPPPAGSPLPISRYDPDPSWTPVN